MKFERLDWYTFYTWKNNDSEECVIPGYQIIELLNFWQKNKEKCENVIKFLDLIKEVVK